MSAQHTPGPWQAGMDSHMVPFVKAGPITIATIWIPPVGEALNNARLIAAAPYMLAALEMIESVYRLNCVSEGEPSSVLAALQDAIAKATGAAS